MGGWDDKINKEMVAKFVIIIDPHENGLSLVECPQKISKSNSCDA